VSTDPSDAAAAASHSDPLVTVTLLRYPLRLGQRATEHYSEVFREFALLAADVPVHVDDRRHGDDVPARLLALVDALGRAYPPQQAHEDERAAALTLGERERDLAVTVPASAADASQTLGEMLDETDTFCREGKLLTLAASEDVAAFRRWYLAQVIDQVAGRPPVPWSGVLD
jgi:hypothetical protein